MASLTSNKGVYSLEVVISVGIFSIVFVAIFLLFASSLSDSVQLVRQHRAGSYAEEAFHAIRAIRDTNYDDLVPGLHGLVLNGNSWEFQGLSDQLNGVFTRSVELIDQGTEGTDISVTVTWPFKNRFITYNSFSRLTNWMNVEVWGDWGNPFVVSTLDFGPQGRGTDIDYYDGTVYLTADISSGSVPSFFAADVSDPQNPSILSDYTSGYDYNAVTILPSSNIAYVVGEESSGELSIFSIANPSAVSLSSQIDLGDSGLAVLIDGNTLIVGTGIGIEFFDISTPASPVPLSIYTHGAAVYDIRVSADTLYAATALNTEEILMLDISDPSTPTYANAYDIDGNTDGTAIHITGSHLYLGRDNNTSGGSELYKYSLDTATTITETSSLDIGGSVQQILTAGPYVYVASAASNEEFQVYISTGDDLSYHTGLNMSQVATGLAFDENTIFITLRSNDAFQIIQPAP